MEAKDLKSALAYSMKYEAAKTVSKTSRNVRSIEVEDGTGKEKHEKFDCLLKTLEKLLNSHVAGKKNTPRRNPNMTCWKCNKNIQWWISLLVLKNFPNHYGSRQSWRILKGLMKNNEQQ
ncbi:hypothetical protein AVEN_273503-1 [Araneus ventricosus]|uniref:Uncharacterized protein n=1 Tax=Araneus ventricosus TaxID=182803 RepID=A0A4Y2H4U3_ARAVE|nr:hypothetical protein AVEN_273503-1 [Araneus ventricosus]